MAWVIGQHGLLGSALVRAQPVGTALFEPSTRFQWGSPDLLFDQLKEAVFAFTEAVRSAESWSIYWAAGIATMHTRSDAMQIESGFIARLLGLLSDVALADVCPGKLAFASSAGGIYAGSTDRLVSEHSDEAPTSDYATVKLEQERMLLAFANRNPAVGVLVARCSTLYGRGQAAGKAQGLLTHISRQIIRGLPVSIYVPLDTIRDYLEVEDAARAMIAATEHVKHGTALTKIIASERPTTISEIVGVFRKVSRRPPKIITSSGKASAVYKRQIQFESAVAPDLRSLYRTSLVVGVASVLEAERRRYAGAAGRNQTPRPATATVTSTATATATATESRHARSRV